MKYLDPKADLTFKKIFGNHPKRLISLLHALLPLSEEEQIHEIKSVSYTHLCKDYSLITHLLGLNPTQ